MHLGFLAMFCSVNYVALGSDSNDFRLDGLGVTGPQGYEGDKNSTLQKFLQTGFIYLSPNIFTYQFSKLVSIHFLKELVERIW